VIQARIKVLNDLEIELSYVDVNELEASKNDWGTCNIDKKTSPAAYMLLKEFDKQTVHLTGYGMGDACGYSLWDINVGAIYVDQSKNTKSLSTLKDTLICKNCGQFGETWAWWEIASSEACFAFRRSNDKVSDCNHDFIKVKRTKESVKGSTTSWFWTYDTDKDKHSDLFKGRDNIVIFNSLEDFYHASFFAALGNKRRCGWIFNPYAADGLRKALKDKGECYKQLKEKEKYFVNNLTIPIEDDLNTQAATELNTLLNKYGYLDKEKM